MSGLGGGSGPGGICSQGGLVWGEVSGLGVVCSRGVWSGGFFGPGGCLLLRGISQHALRQTPLPPVDRQMPVKILPWPNFVAAGKYGIPMKFY